MRRAKRKEMLRTASYNIHIIGVPAPGVRDLYHALLRVPWWAAFTIIVGGYLLLNGIFALLYLWIGGVANVRPGSVLDAFFFSVQTMGTVGYGSMYPASTAANVLVVAESVTSLVVTALATGLVFVRFSQTRARLVFSSKVAVGPMDGVPTLMLRVGNERRGNIVGTQFRLTFTRTSKTAEGVTIYRLEELPLVRSRAPELDRHGPDPATKKANPKPACALSAISILLWFVISAEPSWSHRGALRLARSFPFHGSPGSSAMISFCTRSMPTGMSNVAPGGKRIGMSSAKAGRWLLVAKFSSKMARVISCPSFFV